MKLIIAIVNNEDAKVVTPKLMEEGFSATTLNTTGGFLRAGNTTLLVATEEENVDKVRAVFAQYSNTRNTAAHKTGIINIRASIRLDVCFFSSTVISVSSISVSSV